MENQLSVKAVPFMGDELMAAKDEETGKIYAGVSYICKGIGLTEKQKDNEVSKIQKDLVLQKGAKKLPLKFEGQVREVQCIELDFVPLWLAKITITPTMQTEHPEVADKLVQYQLKAKDVLAAAFIQPQKPMSTLDFLEYTVKAIREQQEALSDTNKRIDHIGDVIALDTRSWRKDAHNLIVQIAKKLGGFENMQTVQAEIYRLVDQRGGVSLERRLTFMQQRMANEGVCKSKRDRLSKLDVIAEDKKLIEIYVAIVKEMAIKNGIDYEPRKEETA